MCGPEGGPSIQCVAQRPGGLHRRHPSAIVHGSGCGAAACPPGPISTSWRPKCCHRTRGEIKGRPRALAYTRTLLVLWGEPWPILGHGLGTAWVVPGAPVGPSPSTHRVALVPLAVDFAAEGAGLEHLVVSHRWETPSHVNRTRNAS